MRSSGRSRRADGAENTQRPAPRRWRTKDLLLRLLLLSLLPDLPQRLRPPRSLSERLQGNPGRGRWQPQRGSALWRTETRKAIDPASGGMCAHEVCVGLKRTVTNPQESSTGEARSDQRTCTHGTRDQGQMQVRGRPESRHI